jgi:hypothetical protein
MIRTLSCGRGAAIFLIRLHKVPLDSRFARLVAIGPAFGVIWVSGRNGPEDSAADSAPCRDTTPHEIDETNRLFSRNRVV